MDIERTTVTIPTEFNIGALADAISSASIAVRLCRTRAEHAFTTSRLAGLSEAWALLTIPQDELRELVKRGPEGGREFMATVELVTMSIAAEESFVAVKKEA